MGAEDFDLPVMGVKSGMMKPPVVPQAQISEKKMGLLTYPGSSRLPGVTQ